MGRLSSRVGYWSAGLALVLVMAMLGISGHGLPAIGVQMLNGEAWLVNTAYRSVSLVDGYSGKVSSQVGLPGVSGNLQVVNTPEGAVVAEQNGSLVRVSNDNFTTSDPIELLGGGAVTAAAGQNVLYALDQVTGKIQQLDPSSPNLTPIGLAISVGGPVTTPVVAADGSLYVAISGSGAVGHVTDGHLAIIKGIGPSGDRLAVTLAGTELVAADLSTGTVMPLGPTAVNGPRIRIPDVSQPTELVGSDVSNGLVGLISTDAVERVDVLTGAISTTKLRPAFSSTARAMQGQNVVLINDERHDVLVVHTATHVVKTLTMPGSQPPDQITVRDRLVFVNASNGPSALVINGSGGVKTVTKYTSPPKTHPKPAKFPTAVKTKPPVTSPVTSQTQKTPRLPGAPVSPKAAPGNASATVSWGAADPNASPITKYVLNWSGSDGSTGNKTVFGTTLGTPVTGLSNGIRYVFTIAAVNGVGRGPGATTGPVTPSSAVPDAPTKVTATTPNPDGSVALTWSAPDNGHNIASYTVTDVGTGAVLQTGITGTSATIGPSPDLPVGTPVQFEVTAIGTSGASGAPSAPSGTVTPYLTPQAPSLQGSVNYAQDGKSVTFSMACDTTCQQGRPAQTYQVTLNPSGPSVSPVTAAADGTATITLSGLTPNTNYTASVTVTDSAGATGPPDVISLAMPGPPSVSNVKVSGNGLTLNVTATVTDGGESTTCSVSVSGGGSASGSCSGTIQVGVSTYNTTYNVTFTATNAAGTNSQTGSGKSGLKALTADARDSFGTCPNGHQYCGGNSHVEPSPNFVANNGAPLITQGTPVTADCYTTGGMDYGIVAYTGGTNVWVHMTSSVGSGYMSILWFPNPGSVTSGLPHC